MFHVGGDLVAGSARVSTKWGRTVRRFTMVCKTGACPYSPTPLTTGSVLLPNLLPYVPEPAASPMGSTASKIIPRGDYSSARWRSSVVWRLELRGIRGECRRHLILYMLKALG